MVAKAAGLFPDRIMVGFDVAITDRGPVIIEGNVQQGSDMVQRTHDLPVGLQRLGELLAYQASEALATRPPRAMRWYGPARLLGSALRNQNSPKAFSLQRAPMRWTRAYPREERDRASTSLPFCCR